MKTKMAEIWPILLLLLPLFNPLLSKHLFNDKTDNSTDQALNLTEETYFPTSHIGPVQDNISTTVAFGTSSKPVETTSETYVSTKEDSTQEPTDTTDLSSLVGTEKPQTTSDNSESHTTTKGKSDGPSFAWHQSSMAPAGTTSSPKPTTTPHPPVESTSDAGPNANTHALPTTTRLVETPASTTQPPLSTLGTTNSSIGALIPRGNAEGNHPLTTPPQKKPAMTTTGNKAPVDKDHFPCTTVTPRRDGLVGQCLIAIAALAGVATIFIVSTIILCTKLSSSKYRYRMSQTYGTEMVCISALLPDGNGTHGRPRIPKSNGALIPSTEDSEGDDLTLHSFLPETERSS